MHPVRGWADATRSGPARRPAAFRPRYSEAVR